MPQWFVILAKVLSMLSYLVPLAEKQFSTDAGNGTEKKQFVLEQIGGWLDGPHAKAAKPDLDDTDREGLLRLAAATVDNMVLAANESQAWTDPAPSVG